VRDAVKELLMRNELLHLVAIKLNQVFDPVGVIGWAAILVLDALSGASSKVGSSARKAQWTKSKGWATGTLP
jgi:hypothetical protein